jgi:hypothetical protein
VFAQFAVGKVKMNVGHLRRNLLHDLSRLLL